MCQPGTQDNARLEQSLFWVLMNRGGKMDANLVFAFSVLSILTGGIAMSAALVSIWKDNTTFAALRVLLNLSAVVFSVLAGNWIAAGIWSATTVISIVALAAKRR